MAVFVGGTGAYSRPGMVDLGVRLARQAGPLVAQPDCQVVDQRPGALGPGRQALFRRQPGDVALDGEQGVDAGHRLDVAKVETFLGDAGYYKPLTNDGPSGWHSTNLDSAIRSFQKDHGLAVDGVLKPGGPTIGKIGSLLGGGTSPAKTAQGVWGGPNNDQPGIPDMPWPPRAPKPPVEVGTGPTFPWPKPKPPVDGPDPWPKPKPPVDGPDLPGGDIWEKPQPPRGGQDDLEALIRIMNGGQKPEPAGTPPSRPTPPRLPPITRPHDGGIAHPPTTLPDRFLGHTISESGAKEHDDWAKLWCGIATPARPRAC